MGCIVSKPSHREKFNAPDFRLKRRKPDSDEELEVLRDFISLSPEESIRLDIEKNELWKRRMRYYGLNCKIELSKGMIIIVKS